MAFINERAQARVWFYLDKFTSISVVRTINKHFLVQQKPRNNKLILLWHCQDKYIQHFQAIITPAVHNHQIAAAHQQHHDVFWKNHQHDRQLLSKLFITNSSIRGGKVSWSATESVDTLYLD